MTKTDPTRAPGYRGSLPAREDRLARPWILTIIGGFALILVLSVLGVPSRFIPDPTPIPLPSILASGSIEPSPEGSPSAEASASGSASAEASASVEPSPSGQ